MIKDFGLKIFNCSQNFYVKCGLGVAQNFTAPRNFAEAEARFNARNFNARTSRSATDTAARCFNAEANSNGTRNSAVAHNPASIRTRAATQNFSAQNFTASSNFVAIRARLAAQNFISRAVSSYADQKRSRLLSSPRARRIECAPAPCHVAVPRADKFAFAAPSCRAWIKFIVLPCRAQIKLARADNNIGELN